MTNVKTVKKEIVETIEWHPRKKINCLALQFEGLFFILNVARDNIKEMHLFCSY
jgi:hypothetical protein